MKPSKNQASVLGTVSVLVALTANPEIDPRVCHSKRGLGTPLAASLPRRPQGAAHALVAAVCARGPRAIDLRS